MHPFSLSQRHSHQGHSSISNAGGGGLAPVLVTSLSGNLGSHSSHSKSAAAVFVRPGGGGQVGNGVNNDRGGGGLAALGSLGSQRNLKVGNLLKAKPRADGGSAELPRQYPRGGEATPAALSLQVRRGAGVFLSCSCFALFPATGLSLGKLCATIERRRECLHDRFAEGTGGKLTTTNNDDDGESTVLLGGVSKWWAFGRDLPPMILRTRN